MRRFIVEVWEGEGFCRLGGVCWCDGLGFGLDWVVGVVRGDRWEGGWGANGAGGYVMAIIWRCWLGESDFEVVNGTSGDGSMEGGNVVICGDASEILE